MMPADQLSRILADCVSIADRGECVCTSTGGCSCNCECEIAPASKKPYSGHDCGCDPDYCYSEQYPEVRWRHRLC